MASFLGKDYAPPGTYTRTIFESPLSSAIAPDRLPVIIGTGLEILTQQDLAVARGSSPFVDQEVPREDVAGRAVSQILDSGDVQITDFNGVINRFQVRNFPIVRGDGSGTVTTNRSDVEVTINGEVAVVLGVDGDRGVVTIADQPALTDDVRITYSFNREDTQFTDDVSSQVSASSAALYGEIGLGGAETFDVVTGSTDEFLITVDGLTETTITLPAGSFTAPQMASLINGQAPGTLVASTFVNNDGDTALVLTAAQDIVIGDGSANALFGFTAGDRTSRNRTFFTFQGPIVDGSNGGITTTSVADVTVTVDGAAVTPVAVDGANRSVTLGYAPPAGSVVRITYFANTWQNTFDYLGHINVTDVLRCGITPQRNDFIEGVDFILKDDKILWGSAFFIQAGDTTAGAQPLDETKVSATLVDNKVYLAACTPVVNTSVTPAVQDRKNFTLPFVATTGNGRNTPIGQSLFQSVSNNRIDLPTNRPDLVIAYWGYSLQDALDRGPVPVVKVDAETAQITLQDPVEVGATVWATFYYNTLADDTYTLTVSVAGSAGVGTYTVTDQNGASLYDVSFGAKSAGLTGITVQFPSGSELLPDAFIGAGTGGPVEEVVTVTFGSTENTPAIFTFPGSDPYTTITSGSDHLRVLIDSSDLAAGAAGVDLSDPTGAGVGFFASLVGEEVTYDAASGGTTYEITADNAEVSLTVDGVLISATAATGATQTLADFVTAINTAATATGNETRYTAATRFTSPYTVAAGEYDTLTLHYTGDVAGASGNQVITLTPGTYNSVNLLVDEINTQLDTIDGALLLLAAVDAVANADGQIEFILTSLGAGDSAGVLEFVTGAAGADFAVVAGIDTAAATGGTQTKIYNGPIARRFTVGAGALNHDRIILRNRILPGSGTMQPEHQVQQTGITIQGSSGATLTGLAVGQTAQAGWTATTSPATLTGFVGFSGGQETGAGDASDSQPLVVFYDGTGTEPQNNVFKFTLDGTPVTTVFTASSSGTATALGPGSISGTVIEQIAGAMATAGFGANAAAVLAADLIAQEGAGIRIKSARTDQFSALDIGTGSANSVLGFVDNASDLRDLVDVRRLASALMGNHAGALTSTTILDFATPAATYFAAEALAGVASDALGAEYLFIQSQSVGTSSSVVLGTASSDDALRIGTGLGATAGEGSVGEAGISGFFVTSSDPADGSGTANTSVLNSGTGQDGVVGQTYIDAVTGLTFTILPREGGFAYPAGETFTFQVSRTFTTDANIPTLSIPGVELIVSNTSGTVAGDTGTVETFDRQGSEPAVGDSYYVTYDFTKEDFSTQIFTRLNVIENNFGTRNPNNPVSLAAFLMLTNGATTVAVKQVQKDAGEDFASLDKYVSALGDLYRPLPGGLTADLLIPLVGSSLDFFQILATHCDVQSSVRYRQERTAIIGLTPSVTPQEAGRIAQQISNSRISLVYPDVAVLSVSDALGNTEQFVVEGYYLAAALAGSTVSPNLDVATPWTNRRLFGFDRLGRILDAVEMNQMATRGVIVISEDGSALRVRDGITTDTTDVLTRLPTVRLIADDVQKRSRQALRRYIGVKFVRGILGDIQGTLGSLMQDLVKSDIITAYRDVSAVSSPEDPTTAEVEAFYSPVFPLKYIQVTFNLRSSLT